MAASPGRPPLSPAALARVGVGGLVLVVLVLAGSVAVPRGEDLTLYALAPLSAIAIGCAGTGALLLARRPENPIGRLLCLIGAAQGVALAAQVYAFNAEIVQRGDLPLGSEAGLLSELLFIVAFTVIPFLFLLFPTGRLPSPGWRWVWRVNAVALVGVTIATLLHPGRIEGIKDFEVVNPIGVEALANATETLAGVSLSLATLAVAAATLSVLTRLRSGSVTERQQVKWFAVAVAVFAAGILPERLGLLANDSLYKYLLLGLGAFLLPVAVGIAILRYRLSDIDVVINRTLVYGALSAVLLGVYLGGVLLLQLALSPLTEGSSLAVPGSTLAVAALFRPARARVQGAVDRRFYRHKYDAARTLEEFGARLRDEVDLDALAADLCAVVQETMQPAHVSLWLRDAPR